MRPGCQDLNVKKFTFSSCRPGRGRQGYSFEIFRNRHIFLKFNFFKYKNEKKSARGRATTSFAKTGLEPRTTCSRAAVSRSFHRQFLFAVSFASLKLLVRRPWSTTKSITCCAFQGNNTYCTPMLLETRERS